MKRNLILTALFLALSTQLIFAQRMRPQMMQGPRKLTIDQRLKNLDDLLNLTADQKKSIRKIFENADTRMKEIYEQNKGNRQAMRAAAVDQREKTNTQILNLLNDSQKEKYKNYLKQRPNQPMPERNPRGRSGRGRMRF